MKTIKFKTDKGEIKVFNPLYVTDVKLENANDDWCLSFCTTSPRESLFTKVYSSKDDAVDGLNMVISAIESVSYEGHRV